MGTKTLVIMAAVVSASIGAVALLANTKQAKTKRMLKKAGKAMYTVGTMLRTMSCASTN